MATHRGVRSSRAAQRAPTRWICSATHSRSPICTRTAASSPICAVRRPASQNYRRVAQVQYRTGLTDYLVVIDAERTLLANQLALAQSRNSHLAASIHLIKALGGGWRGES
jgi:hypothetical protein